MKLIAAAAALLVGTPAQPEQAVVTADLSRAFRSGAVGLCDLSPEAARLVLAMSRVRTGARTATMDRGLRATIQRHRRRIGGGSFENVVRATFVGRVTWRGLPVRYLEERSFYNPESESPIRRELALAAPVQVVRRELSRLRQEISIAPGRRVVENVGLNGASLWIEPRGVSTAIFCESNS